MRLFPWLLLSLHAAQFGLIVPFPSEANAMHVSSTSGTWIPIPTFRDEPSWNATSDRAPQPPENSSFLSHDNDNDTDTDQSSFLVPFDPIVTEGEVPSSRAAIPFERIDATFLYADASEGSAAAVESGIFDKSDVTWNWPSVGDLAFSDYNQTHKVDPTEAASSSKEVIAQTQGNDAQISNVPILRIPSSSTVDRQPAAPESTINPTLDSTLSPPSSSSSLGDADLILKGTTTAAALHPNERRVETSSLRTDLTSELGIVSESLSLNSSAPPPNDGVTTDSLLSVTKFDNVLPIINMVPSAEAPMPTLLGDQNLPGNNPVPTGSATPDPASDVKDGDSFLRSVTAQSELSSTPIITKMTSMSDTSGSGNLSHEPLLATNPPNSPQTHPQAFEPTFLPTVASVILGSSVGNRISPPTTSVTMIPTPFTTPSSVTISLPTAPSVLNNPNAVQELSVPKAPSALDDSPIHHESSTVRGGLANRLLMRTIQRRRLLLPTSTTDFDALRPTLRTRQGHSLGLFAFPVTTRQTTTPLAILSETLAPPVLQMDDLELLHDYPSDDSNHGPDVFDDDQPSNSLISPATTNTIIISGVIGGCAIVFFAIMMIFCMCRQHNTRRTRYRQPPELGSNHINGKLAM